MDIKKNESKEIFAIEFYRLKILENPIKPIYFKDFVKLSPYSGLDKTIDMLQTLVDLKLVFWIKSENINDSYIFKRNIIKRGGSREINREDELEDLLNFRDNVVDRSIDEEIINYYDSYIAHVEPDMPFTKGLIDLCVNTIRNKNEQFEIFQNLNDHEIVLYIIIINAYCRDLRRITSINNMEDIFGFYNATRLFKRIRNKESMLIKNDLIEIDHLDENSLDISFRLSKNSKRLLGISNEVASELTFFEIQDPNNIEKSTLIFDDSFNDKVDNIEKVICSDIKNSELKSIKILFFGDPGTGKTTLTQNIAVNSNRKLLHLNGSKLLSMWADETPKNIDRAFDEYRKISASEDRYPILFFDECDQIVTKRTNADNSSYKSDENKTIIRLLRRLDSFEGILIFASNLFNEIDPALNDRFLFKLKFENPDPLILDKIIKNKFDFLGKYNLSIDPDISLYRDLNPRQIENIKKKLYLMKIIQKKAVSLDELIKEELQLKNRFERTKIGF